MPERLSIIIPAFNEAKNLQALLPEIRQILQEHSIRETEIIVIDDGSTDGTSLFLQDQQCTLITFKVNRGKAAALQAGFEQATGDIIITMDADLQDDPKEIPRFIAKINEGYDVVSGRKFHRVDSFIKNETSKIYNTFTSVMSGVYLHDHNCGFKAYRAPVVKSFRLDGELHRYIPVLARAHGFKKITEININHRKRREGKTKYNWTRFFWGIIGFVDVVIVTKGNALAIVRRFKHI